MPDNQTITGTDSASTAEGVSGRVDRLVGRRLTERFIRGLDFRVTHCGWMQRGCVRVSGPPATSNINEWKWYVDDELLPKQLQPRTESALLMLLAVVRD